MKRILLTFVLILTALPLFAQQYVMTSEGYRIQGQVKKSMGYATLRTYLPDGNELLDSVLIDKKGKFVFRGYAKEPMPTLLTINGKKKYRLYVEPQMDMQLTIDPKSDIPTIKNAKQTTRWYSIVTPQGKEDYDVYLSRLENWVVNNPEDIFAADIMATYLSHYWTYDDLSRHLNTLKGKATEVYYYKHLRDREVSLQKLAIGQKAPEIRLKDLNNKDISLNSFIRGKKYILVDFWASWCSPCREEMANLVECYDKYNAKGFDIYGISLDKTQKAWKKAVENDGIKWTTVSDLKMWESPAVKDYMIKSIPDNILVDANGKIIAKNLRGKELQDVLQQLMDVASFKITGNIQGIKEGVVKLTLLKKDGEKETFTERIQNGTFVFNGHVDRVCMAMIDLPMRDGDFSFFLDNDIVQISGEKKNIDKVNIQGSKAQDKFKSIAESCNRQKNPMQALMYWVMDNPNSIYSPFIISNYLYPYMSEDDRVKAIQSLGGEAKDMFQYHLLLQQIGQEKAQIDQLTSKAKDFTLEDLKGDLVSLYSYIQKSSYTLISFWASWDNNSRRDNIDYLRLFKQTKRQQFNIISVSLDDNQYAWENAVNTDGIAKWTNVSDLKRWNSAVVKLYNLKTIPSNVLVDKEGTILGKDLSIEQIINIINQK